MTRKLISLTDYETKIQYLSELQRLTCFVLYVRVLSLLCSVFFSLRTLNFVIVIVVWLVSFVFELHHSHIHLIDPGEWVQLIFWNQLAWIVCVHTCLVYYIGLYRIYSWCRNLCKHILMLSVFRQNRLKSSGPCWRSFLLHSSVFTLGRQL